MIMKTEKFRDLYGKQAGNSKVLKDSSSPSQGAWKPGEQWCKFQLEFEPKRKRGPVS